MASYIFPIFVVLVMLSCISAQFGVPKPEGNTEILSSGKQKEQEETPSGISYLTEQDAANIEAFVLTVADDPETMEMVKKMKNEMTPELIELSKMPKEEVIGGIKQVVDELLMLDKLFSDKERALMEFDREGLIPKESLETYKKNPELLEQDVRQGLKMQFVTLATVGGFL